MKKERKLTVLLMLGGIVFMILMDAAGHYLAGNWYPYAFLLTVKNVLYVVEWTGIGFGLGLLAHGGRMKGIRISKAYLVGALMAFLIGAFQKRIYDIIPRSMMEWLYAQEISIRIYENWFFAIAGLLLFLGVTSTPKTSGKSGRKLEWITCGVFLLLLFPLGQLGYKALQIPDEAGQQVYVALYFVRFLLFGIVASLTAVPGAAEIPQKADSLKSGTLCLALSLGWFFLTKWSLVSDHPVILWEGAYCSALMLAAYGGLFLTKGALEARRGRDGEKVVEKADHAVKR